MKTSTPRHNLALLLLRIPYGLFFLLAGYGKIAGGVNNFVASQLHNVPAFLPAPLGNAYLHTLPFVELISGAMIIAGLYTRFVALIQILLLVSFLIAVGVKPPSGPFHFNFILLAIALLFALIGPGGWSIDAELISRNPEPA